jgi:hypothetical protein
MDNEMCITRTAYDKLEIEIGGKKAEIKTEDLATIVRFELPEDRAKHIFDEMEEKRIMKGKARIKLTALVDIKKGEEIRATIDMTRYVDLVDQYAEKAKKKNGILIPSFAGVRTNNQGFIF